MVNNSYPVIKMKNINILISGAGIAGLTLAFWLKKHGFNPVIVEKASSLREGGYMIDFWGLGFDVAEKMGILAELEKHHYNIPELLFVDKENNKTGGLNILKLRKLINFRHFNLLRGDLAKIIYDLIYEKIEFIWDTSIDKIEQFPDCLTISFKNGVKRKFDLLIGADGLHSNVRKRIFGQEQNFEKYLCYYTSSFTINNYLNKKDAFYSFSVPGKQIGIYSISENKLSTFFIFRQKEKLVYDYHKSDLAKHLLFETFKDTGWESKNILEKMDTSPDFYFDTVSQINMENWSRGRISLVGDACQCVSLIAGAGSSLAMAGAYILAGELKKTKGDFETAFQNYQKILQPEILIKQKMAKKFAGSFIPHSNFGIWVRDKSSNILFLPIISKWFLKQFMSDNVKLESY
jgi:2-polyprenyl-6-methoxyphenol hydroxylase-like FAD-dependent oxidoreductase